MPHSLNASYLLNAPTWIPKNEIDTPGVYQAIYGNFYTYCYCKKKANQA